MINTKTDVKLTRKEYTPEEEKEIEQGTPQWQDEFELDEEQKRRVLKELKAEREEIQKERDEIDLENRCDSADRQYYGDVDRVTGLMFNIHKHTTKIKVDVVTRHICQALFESDPVISVTPRPEYARNDGFKTCEKIEDHLDYEIDEVIPLEETYQLVTYNTVCKPIGWLKIPYVIRQERKTREETYGGQPISVDEQGQDVNEELGRFLQAYPDARTDNPDLVKDLEEGKEINIIADYNETTYNAAYPTNVDPKNLYVRRMTEGYDGLCRTRLIEEDLEYTFWELKGMEKDGLLYDVDALKYKKNDKERKKAIMGYENKKYQITQSVYYFKENETDEDGEETKLIIWRERDREMIIGSIRYPYYGVPCFYIPHWIQKTMPGMYQKSLSEFLAPSNIAENAILNLLLQSVYIRNTFSPISKPGSSTYKQLLEKRFTWGMNLDADEAIDSVQAHMPQVDSQGLLSIMEYLVRGDDDVSGASSGMSGKSDPIDPRAPASKTIALLEKSGVNIHAYIKCFVKSFNITINVILQLNYQMASKEGRKFRTKPDREGDIFGTITRDEMAAKVNIQSQAYAFNFHKQNEKKEDLALMQVLLESPLFRDNPKAVYNLYGHIITGWSPKWKNIKERIWPSPEEFKSEQLQVAIQAIGLYFKQITELREAGKEVPIDPNEILSIMKQFMAEAVVPPTEQEVKQREKDAKQVDKDKQDAGVA